MFFSGRAKAAMGSVVPLTPTMSSRKALVLDFVTRWLGDHPGSSPSLSMIAAATGTHKKGAWDLVDALVHERKLLRGPRGRPGTPRALMLPTTLERAKAELAATGWIIDDAVRWAGPPERAVTFPTLPLLAAPGQTAGDGFGWSGGDGADGR